MSLILVVLAILIDQGSFQPLNRDILEPVRDNSISDIEKSFYNVTTDLHYIRSLENERSIERWLNQYLNKLQERNRTRRLMLQRMSKGPSNTHGFSGDTKRTERRRSSEELKLPDSYNTQSHYFSHNRHNNATSMGFNCIVFSLLMSLS